MKEFLELVDRKSHIIWDWNGTLLNDVHHAHQVCNQLLREHSLNEIEVETYRRTFRFPVREYYKEVGFDLEKICFEKLSDRFVELFMSQISRASLFSHAELILKALKDRNKKQFVLSAADQENLHHLIGHFKLDHYFEHVAGLSDKFAGSKVLRGKELIDFAQINPRDAILVGDTDHDLEVAEALGVDVLLIAHGHQHEERLRALTDRVVLIEEDVL